MDAENGSRREPVKGQNDGDGAESTRKRGLWSGIEQENGVQIEPRPHDLRPAIYGPNDAWCTICITCSSLWWAPNADPDDVVPAECSERRRLSAGFAWIQGVPDDVLDAINAKLIEQGMGTRVAVFRIHSAQRGVYLDHMHLWSRQEGHDTNFRHDASCWCRWPDRFRYGNRIYEWRP